MSKVATEIHFVDPTKEGLDWDTDPSVIEVGNSRYRLCCRSKRSGRIENIKGTVEKTFQLPPGINTVVVRCTNTTEDYIVWGIYNSQGNDIILKYTIASDQVQIVIGAPNPLNFHPDYPAHNPKIIGDEFVYTDGYNEPRSFDLEKARLHTAGQGGYIVIDEQVIEAIKYPPLKAPEVQYGSNFNVSINNLRGKLWQFAYRWVYDDNAKSVLSPTSKVPLPQGDELIGGIYADNYLANNVITIKVDTGHHIVERIEIFARDSNISNWFMIDVLDKEEMGLASFVVYNYLYYNNTNRIAVDPGDVNRLFDILPERAMQQDVVNGEYLVYGNYLDGKDNINIEAGATVLPGIVDYTDSRESMPPFEWTFPPQGVTFELPAVVKKNQVVVVRFYIRDTVSGVFPNWFYDTTPPVSLYVARYVVRDGDTRADVAQGISDAINDIIKENYDDVIIPPFSTTIVAEPIVPVPPVTQPMDFIVYVMFERVSDSKTFYITQVLTDVYEGITKVKSFKQGSYHQIGLVYSDLQGRLGNVQTQDSMQVYIPYWSEENQFFAMNRMIYFRIRYNISHIPPDWAHKCHIVYSKSQTLLSFLQYFIKKVDIVKQSSLDRHAIKINEVITNVNDVWTNSIVGTYSWNKGDRLRIMYKVVAPAISAYSPLPKLLDVEILSQDQVTGDIYIPLVDMATYGIDEDAVFYGVLIEIYTPRKEAIETERYWEIGETIDIINPGLPQRAHSPNNGIIDSGDVYINHRVGEEINYPCETLLYSDFYHSNDFDYGRGNITNKDAERKWLISYYRAGGRKILDTKLNEFYRFNAEDFDSIGEMHGQITGLRQVGDTLKIYLENKCASQYIFRTSLVDISGEESLQKSDKLFGSKILSSFEYGCQDPGSIIVNDRHVYFMDAIRGVYCRDAANGIYPISSYKMVNFWREKAEILRMNRGKYKITTGYNKDYNELNVTVVSDFDEQYGYYFESFTVLFMEEENRWKTFMPYLPELYGRIGSKLVSFKDGQLHLHDSNSIRNNFYGVQYNMLIDVFGNMPPKQNKVYDAIAIHSNRPFEAPNKGDVYVYPSESYPDGMESRLKAGKFELLEGVYYASFLNDMLDPHFADEVDALLNGRPLRGKVIRVLMSNVDTTEVSLHFVTIKATISEHTD